jgi:hypothetical protein
VSCKAVTIAAGSTATFLNWGGSQSGTTSSGSAIVTLTSTAGIYPGLDWKVTGSCAPAGAAILSVDSSTQIHMTVNGTSNAGACTLTIGGGPGFISRASIGGGWANAFDASNTVFTMNADSKNYYNNLLYYYGDIGQIAFNSSQTVGATSNFVSATQQRGVAGNVRVDQRFISPFKNTMLASVTCPSNAAASCQVWVPIYYTVGVNANWGRFQYLHSDYTGVQNLVGTSLLFTTCSYTNGSAVATNCTGSSGLGNVAVGLYVDADYSGSGVADGTTIASGASSSGFTMSAPFAGTTGTYATLLSAARLYNPCTVTAVGPAYSGPGAVWGTDNAGWFTSGAIETPPMDVLDSHTVMDSGLEDSVDDTWSFSMFFQEHTSAGAYQLPNPVVGSPSWVPWYRYPNEARFFNSTYQQEYAAGTVAQGCPAGRTAYGRANYVYTAN